MTWLWITLNFTAKAFHISNTRTESILSTLNNLTSTLYVATRKVAQIIDKVVSTIFVLGNIVILKTRYLHKSFWRKHRGVHFKFQCTLLPFRNKLNNILETKHSDIKQKTTNSLQITNYIVFWLKQFRDRYMLWNKRGKIFYPQKLF